MTGLKKRKELSHVSDSLGCSFGPLDLYATFAPLDVYATPIGHIRHTQARIQELVKGGALLKIFY